MNPPDDIAWVRHINGRWIVRESLRKDTVAFLDHLAATDPDRLRRACARARILSGAHPGEDPKPWFYAGLFSLATLEEARRHLRGHDFICACIPTFAGAGLGNLRPEDVRLNTAEKMQRVREALEAMGSEFRP